MEEMNSEIRRLERENAELRDNLERFALKLDQLQARYNKLAKTKAELSEEVIKSEEEKLKASKSMVEAQIENNKLREDLEATKFELSNKLLMIENELVEVNQDRSKIDKKLRNNRERLGDAEKDRKDLAEEYVALKSNYAALVKEHEAEIDRNEELSMELLSMANAKAAIIRQMANMNDLTAISNTADLAEVDRVRTLVERLAPNRTFDGGFNVERERADLERAIFGNQQRFKDQLERQKDQYQEQQDRMEERIKKLTQEMEESRQLSRSRQQTISELNAKVITASQERDEVNTQNNRLQHKLKDLNTEYRDRLVKYVADISEYIDRGAGCANPERTADEMRRYCKSMLQEVKRTHRLREEQLSDAAQNYKAMVQRTVKRYEELLVAYRQMRLIVEDNNLGSHIAFPDEASLRLTDGELVTANQREIIRLREELNQTKLKFDQLRITGEIEPAKNTSMEPWTDLRRHVKDFTSRTQQELEDERSRLLAKNQMLEVQLRQNQDYIDTHLRRYREEISRLRRRIGMEERDGRISADLPRENGYRR